MIEIGTFTTWAYVNQQLDYPAWKQVRVHVVANDKTLCGLRVGTNWETGTTESIDGVPWLCCNCRSSYERRERSL